jgi:hypothetical protein
MGSDINTEFDEGGMFLSPDGKTLFFCSNGHNSMGGHTISLELLMKTVLGVNQLI